MEMSSAFNPALLNQRGAGVCLNRRPLQRHTLLCVSAFWVVLETWMEMPEGWPSQSSLPPESLTWKTVFRTIYDSDITVCV